MAGDGCIAPRGVVRDVPDRAVGLHPIEALDRVRDRVGSGVDHPVEIGEHGVDARKGRRRLNLARNRAIAPSSFGSSASASPSAMTAATSSSSTAPGSSSCSGSASVAAAAAGCASGSATTGVTASDPAIALDSAGASGSPSSTRPRRSRRVPTRPDHRARPLREPCGPASRPPRSCVRALRAPRHMPRTVQGCRRTHDRGRVAGSRARQARVRAGQVESSARHRDGQAHLDGNGQLGTVHCATDFERTVGTTDAALAVDHEGKLVVAARDPAIRAELAQREGEVTGGVGRDRERLADDRDAARAARS